MSERTSRTALPRPNAGRLRDVVEDETRVTDFRELVYRLRIEADLTQVELARRMGTTQSAIARMENGGTRPTLETLERVAGAVGQQLAVVVGLPDEPTAADTQQTSLHPEVRQRPGRKRSRPIESEAAADARLED